MARTVMDSLNGNVDDFKTWWYGDDPKEVTVASKAVDEGSQRSLRGNSGQNTIVDMDTAARNRQGSQATVLSQADDAASQNPTENMGVMERFTKKFKQKFVDFKEALLDLKGQAKGKTYNSAWTTFNKTQRYFTGASLGLGLATWIASCFALKDEFENLTSGGKALVVLDCLFSGLAVVIDFALVFGSMSGSMALGLAFLGTSLAVLGILVMVLLLCLKPYKKQEPPPTPVEIFIDEEAIPLINTWPDPPGLQAAATAPESVLTGSTWDEYRLKVQNAKPTTIELSSVTVTIQGGDDPRCLFDERYLADGGVLMHPDDVGDDSNDNFVAAINENDPRIAVRPLAGGLALLGQVKYSDRSTENTDISMWELRVQGSVTEDNPKGLIILPPGAGFEWVFSNVHNSNLEGETLLEVKETQSNGDAVRTAITVKRDAGE